MLHPTESAAKSMHFGLIITCGTVVPFSVLQSCLSCIVLIKAEAILAPWKLAGPQTGRAGVHGMEDEQSKLKQAHNKVIDLGCPFYFLFHCHFHKKLIPLN